MYHLMSISILIPLFLRRDSEIPAKVFHNPVMQTKNPERFPVPDEFTEDLSTTITIFSTIPPQDPNNAECQPATTALF